jgi:hypothetical protein
VEGANESCLLPSIVRPVVRKMVVVALFAMLLAVHHVEVGRFFCLLLLNYLYVFLRHDGQH